MSDGYDRYRDHGHCVVAVHAGRRIVSLDSVPKPARVGIFAAVAYSASVGVFLFAGCPLWLALVVPVGLALLVAALVALAVWAEL